MSEPTRYLSPTALVAAALAHLDLHTLNAGDASSQAHDERHSSTEQKAPDATADASPNQHVLPCDGRCDGGSVSGDSETRLGVYRGELVDGVRSGMGRLTWRTSKVTDGTGSMNKRGGAKNQADAAKPDMQTSAWMAGLAPQMIVYEGEFKDNVRHGRGVQVCVGTLPHCNYS